MSSIFSFLKTLGLAAFIAFFCIRGFIFEPFRIPSSSMVPNLLIGDFLFVSKFAYGNRIPMTDTFLWQGEPERGDIAVFKNKHSDLPGSFFGFGSPMFIKRIIALPGDTIAYNNKQLYVNGQPIPVEALGDVNYQNLNGRSKHVLSYTETFADGTQHTIVHDPSLPGLNVAEETVPADMFVMMGDNRDNSRDSRFWNPPTWGYVPRADLMGRAEFIFFSLDNWAPRLERFFNSLRK